jgi:seryl-tRNA synthetase
MSDADSDTIETDVERLRSDFDSLKQAFQYLDAKVQRVLLGNILKLTESKVRHRTEINELRGKIEAIAEELDRRINAVAEEESESGDGYQAYQSESSTRTSVVAEVFDKLNKTKI